MLLAARRLRQHKGLLVPWAQWVTSLVTNVTKVRPVKPKVEGALPTLSFVFLCTETIAPEAGALQDAAAQPLSTCAPLLSWRRGFQPAGTGEARAGCG